MKNQIKLNDIEVAQVNKLVESYIDTYKNFDDYLFLKDLPMLARNLPLT